MSDQVLDPWIARLAKRMGVSHVTGDMADVRNQSPSARVVWRAPPVGQAYIEAFDCTKKDAATDPIHEARERVEAVIYERDWPGARERLFSLWRAFAADTFTDDRGVGWTYDVEIGPAYRANDYVPESGFIIVQPVLIRYNVPRQTEYTADAESVAVTGSIT